MSRLTMITTSEKATQKSITRPSLSVHHTSFLWALCQEFVLSTTHRKPAVSGGSLALLRDHPHQAPLLKKPTGDLRVVGTIQMHARSIRQLRKWLQRVEDRLQEEWRVVTVGRSD